MNRQADKASKAAVVLQALGVDTATLTEGDLFLHMYAARMIWNDEGGVWRRMERVPEPAVVQQSVRRPPIPEAKRKNINTLVAVDMFRDVTRIAAAEEIPRSIVVCRAIAQYIESGLVPKKESVSGSVFSNRLGFYIDMSTFEIFEKIKEQTGCSVSDQVRFAIAVYLRGVQVPSPSTQVFSREKTKVNFRVAHHILTHLTKQAKEEGVPKAMLMRRLIDTRLSSLTKEDVSRETSGASLMKNYSVEISAQQKIRLQEMADRLGVTPAVVLRALLGS